MILRQGYNINIDVNRHAVYASEAGAPSYAVSFVLD